MKQNGFTHIIVIVLLAIIAGAAVYIAINSSGGATQLPSASPSSSSKPSSTIQPISGQPENNTVYLSKYDSKDVVFYRTPNNSNGQMIFQDGHGEGIADGKQITDYKKVWSTDQEIQGVNGFAIENGMMLLSIIEGPFDQPSNIVILTDLANGTAKEVWWKKLFDVNTAYEDAYGAAYANSVSSGGRYIALDLASCYGCEGTLVGSLILDVENGSQIYLKQIGNIKLNEAENTFSYQKKEGFREWCGEGMGCDSDGYRTVMKPSGSVITQNLP